MGPKRFGMPLGVSFLASPLGTEVPRTPSRCRTAPVSTAWMIVFGSLEVYGAESISLLIVSIVSVETLPPESESTMDLAISRFTVGPGTLFITSLDFFDSVDPVGVGLQTVAIGVLDRRNLPLGDVDACS